MLTSSIPVAGIVVALFAAAASVSVTVLTAAVLLASGTAPVHVGLLFLPELAGAVISAVAFGVGHHPTGDALPAAGGHGLPRRRDRGLPDRRARQPAAGPDRIGR